MSIYRIIRALLFRLSAEKAHEVTMRLLKNFGRWPVVKQAVSGKIEGEDKLGKTVAGIFFPNPIGMAAGFDKNAVYINQLSDLGFGFVEIGTVTPKPQDGNPKPRLFRLVEDQALINRMGFNNDGADMIADRLKRRRRGKIVVGGNIGKNKLTPNNEAVWDYKACFEKLFPLVDYFAVNVSSPNTPNLRELQDRAFLSDLLTQIQLLNKRHEKPKPVFLKIAPDLSFEQVDEIIRIVNETGIAGIIATNTTISREGLKTDEEEVNEIGAGGLSGLPLKEKAIEFLKYLRKNCPPELVIISSGGIMSAEDAAKRIELGADLVQLYSGFIYEGPALLKNIKRLFLNRNGKK